MSVDNLLQHPLHPKTRKKLARPAEAEAGLHMARMEADRLRVLQALAILDTEPEQSYDDITRLAAQVCGTSTALVTLVDAERQWFKSQLGFSFSETPRNIAFCDHTIRQGSFLEVPDAQLDARFASNPFVIGPPNIRFYAGAPLITSDGFAIGSLCVIDQAPRTLTTEQTAILAMLARQVIDRIELTHQVALQGRLVANQTLLLQQQERLVQQQERLVQQQERLVAEKETANEILRQSEEELSAVFDQAVDGIYLFNAATGQILKTNAALRAMLGYAEGDASPATLYDIVAHDKESIDRNIQNLVLKGEMALGARDYRHKEGRIIAAEVCGRVIRYGRGEAFCVTVHDITERRRAEAAERDYQSLFENAAEGIFRTTLEGTYLQANPALARMYGYETPEQLIQELTDIEQCLYVDAERRVQFQSMMRECGCVADFEAQVYRKDGSIIWISESACPVTDDAGEMRWYAGFVQDISERKAMEFEQSRMLTEALQRADRDPLTGLLNHRAFYNALEEETDRAQREGSWLAVAMLDLNNFKFFNDAYGHEAGDNVLRQVADALRLGCRSYDTLARFGGDEFALLLPAVSEAQELAHGLKERLAHVGYRPPGYEATIPIGVSVGIAVFPEEAASRGDIVALADERLRRAKVGGSEAEDLIADLRECLPPSSAEGFAMLSALVTAVDTKDRYTRRHSEDVLAYSLQIAFGLGLDKEARQAVGLAALLHDVGKVGVPDAVLRKPGQLSRTEFEAIRQHPVMGAAIVGAVPGFEVTLDAIRHHHERWDGTGYPSKLKGENIPLIARLMAVADAFSAMTTDRPYRNGMPDAKALSILEEGTGAQWDPACVEAFLRTRRSNRDQTVALNVRL